MNELGNNKRGLAIIILEQEQEKAKLTKQPNNQTKKVLESLEKNEMKKNNSFFEFSLFSFSGRFLQMTSFFKLSTFSVLPTFQNIFQNKKKWSFFRATSLIKYWCPLCLLHGLCFWKTLTSEKKSSNGKFFCSFFFFFFWVFLFSLLAVLLALLCVLWCVVLWCCSLLCAGERERLEVGEVAVAVAVIVIVAECFTVAHWRGVHRVNEIWKKNLKKNLKTKFN